MAKQKKTNGEMVIEEQTQNQVNGDFNVPEQVTAEIVHSPVAGVARASDFGAESKEHHQPSALEIATSRVAQEVQAQMVVAKKFPRNEAVSFQKIMRACKRKGLAEQSMYAYPKGGSMVQGASIRLAEELARDWGNIDFGIVELEQKRGESIMMAYCWDLETNVRQTKVFTVPHKRYTRKGTYPLTDPREIYEMTANQGARRLRACILGVIPGDVVEASVEECKKTLAGNNQEPLGDRVRKMVAVFSQMGVTVEQIEKRLGHNLDATTEIELVNLRSIYTSIKDNMADVRDFFPIDSDGNGEQGDKSAVDSLLDKVKGSQQTKEKANNE